MDDQLKERILGVIFGNASGDAIGLLTEFMNVREAKQYYGEQSGALEYEMKVPDMHRSRWKDGDWTDDTDQMILIMISLIENNGKINHVDFGSRLKQWCRKGFPELGDFGGMGIGATTHKVLSHEKYDKDPHFAANDIWEQTGRFVAPNGALMRTSILGAFQYYSIEKVVENTLAFCKVTHADPRCQASCIALTTAIAFMLQKQPDVLNSNGTFNVKAIIKKSYEEACKALTTSAEKKELKFYMFSEKLSPLKLDEHKKIGYTYKCLGAAFWAFKQNDFRAALEKICFKAGDADTNGATAGALLGCKLGVNKIPPTWLNGLLNKEWLEKHIERFLQVSKEKFNEDKKPQDQEMSTTS